MDDTELNIIRGKNNQILVFNVRSLDDSMGNVTIHHNMEHKKRRSVLGEKGGNESCEVLTGASFIQAIFNEYPLGAWWDCPISSWRHLFGV